MRRRPDTELVVLAREGSTEAAGTLFDRYWIVAWRAAYAVTADRALADDAGQEAFVKAFAALDRFDEMQPFAPWLEEGQVDAAAAAVREAVGAGPNVDRRIEGSRRALMPFVALLSCCRWDSCSIGGTSESG